MSESKLSLFLCIFLSCFVSSFCAVRKFDTVSIEECVPGKYFWRESDPREFYACLTLSKRAVKMRCSAGTYMCNTGPKVFQPCMCKGEPKNAKPEQNDPAGSDKRLKASHMQEGHFDKFAKMAPDGDNGESIASTSGGDSENGGTQADPGNTQWESLPAAGCPDQYKKFPNEHMFGGYSQSFLDLQTCQQACLETPDCIGVDWNRDSDRAENERCYFIFPEAPTRGSLERGLIQDECCDHYRRTACQAPAKIRSLNYKGEGDEDDDFGSRDAVPRNNYVRVGSGPRKAATIEPTLPTAARQATTTPDPTTTPSMTAQGTDIPDSGCPHAFQKFPGVSHPFGQNVTDSPAVDEPEECKYWCLVRAYCRGVDFDANTRTCYYLAQVEPALVSNNVQGVTHFRKIHCTRPLRCYTHSSEVTSQKDTAITDPSTPQTACNGVCYTRETIASTNTVERGCMTSSIPVDLGCQLSNDLLTITCFCDTLRCNALSVMAMASQLLHMPLDGDFSDHSGSNNQASVPDGYSAPDFQCLDKAINCSALFTGSSCIRVTSLAQTEFGIFEPGGDLRFSPEATFAVNFKRISRGSGGDVTEGGIFGNSEDPATAPTWKIATQSHDDYMTAGLTSELTELPSLADYKDVSAPNDQWHLAVMTYEGLMDRENAVFPKLSLYVDGSAPIGNAGLERGKIDISSAPVTVGCLAGNNFFGYIDDARIFVTALSKEDIAALNVMRDVNYWY